MKNSETVPGSKSSYDWRVYDELKKKYNGSTHPGQGDNIYHTFAPKTLHDYYWLCTNLERIGLGHILSPGGTVTVIWP